MQSEETEDLDMTSCLSKQMCHHAHLSKVVAERHGDSDFCKVAPGDGIANDDQQVSVVRCSEHDANGIKREKVVWIAKFADRSREHVEVRADWITSDFPMKFTKDTMLWSGGNFNFIDVPVGAVNTDANDKCIGKNPKHPKVMFQQGEFECCFTHSLASGAHHCLPQHELNCALFPKKIAEMCVHRHDMEKSIKKLQLLMDSIGHTLQELRTNNFNVLDHCSRFPTICVLLGEGGSVKNAAALWET